MAMFYGPPPILYGPEQHGGPERKLPVMPLPKEVEPSFPEPWIVRVIPPEDEKRPPPPMPPIVIIEPVERPPIIAPPPPDIMPETIVPWIYEEPIPESLPTPPMGSMPPVRPPPTLVVAAAAGAVGTFMVYVGKRLVLTMAAALGTSLGKSAGAMLVGAVQKQMFRGTTIRFHSGQSFGEYEGPGSRRASAVPYEQAWRMVPQEFSYWEK